jgi:nickel transport protein
MCLNSNRRPDAASTMRWMVCSFAVTLWLVLCVRPAVAHKVTIFAWVEGDTVYTQSKFSGGKRAKDSTVVVYDKEGNQLLEGKTDEKGEFSFKVPKQTDLKIALKASIGHLAEWTIPAEEIAAGIDKANGGTPEGGVEAATQEAAPLTEAKTSIPTAVTLNRQEVQTLIDESLDRKLAPIVTMLADQVGRGPKVSEVFGGIGYIFGLAGVAFYFSSRRKKGGDVR